MLAVHRHGYRTGLYAASRCVLQVYGFLDGWVSYEYFCLISSSSLLNSLLGLSFLKWFTEIKKTGLQQVNRLSKT